MLGISVTAVQKRLDKGWRGERLMASKYSTQVHARTSRPPQRHMMVTALRLALECRDGIPTLAQIKAIRPMSDEYAKKWRQMLSHARNQAMEDAA